MRKRIETTDGITFSIDGDPEFPHVYAEYENYSATFSLKTGKRITGRFPEEQCEKVDYWILANGERALYQWKCAQSC